MTNLPITSSTAQSVAPGKQNANAADNSDAATQPFGEVLARQIAAPEVKVGKPDDKLAVDLTQAVAETTELKPEDTALPEAAATLPNELLAALMPQVLSSTAASTTPATSAPVANVSATSARTDAPLAVAADKSGKAAAKADTAALLQTSPTGRTEPATASTARNEPVSFGAALGELAARNSAPLRVESAARELAAAPAAPAATAALSAVQNSAAVTAPLLQATQLKVETPVTQPRWGDEFSQKITWLAGSGIDQSAELHLNPPQLGPVDVVIKVSGDQATALFTSPHAAVREAVEQAIPRLRDMMADNGITLGNATVSDQAPRDQGKPEGQRGVADNNNGRTDSVATTGGSARVSPITRHNGIVDTFA
jgi:flagellar hook-length control protein FliK